MSISSKDWRKIQKILKQIGLKGDAEIRAPASHEVDAITATITAYLHLQGKTREVGDKEKGHIVIPEESHWRQPKIE